MTDPTTSPPPLTPDHPVALPTGWDYRGEPTPYAWPDVNSHFGIMDLMGFDKDRENFRGCAVLPPAPNSPERP